ncbi:MAG TPA: YciI family protein [Polyangiaceae bacterium]
MKYVVLGEGAGAAMDAIMKVYPRHKEFLDTLIARGVVIGAGPFTGGGNMAVFRTREAAEKFVDEDPFKLEGLVKSYVIKEWNDALIPE